MNRFPGATIAADLASEEIDIRAAQIERRIARVNNARNLAVASLDTAMGWLRAEIAAVGGDTGMEDQDWIDARAEIVDRFDGLVDWARSTIEESGA